ncbi:mitochondrial enolase superfamily member 1 isoform X3 [Marmota marmota marmota]|uniref:mitochondrial enolase superfamily member 1 isoform X3 n=1 Tax=Marmota marmota marmota TaxID=9994 RepID=UPI0020928D24|nr:mitochondrial enolase superfamily member 1 isoform X3 [Marmota marmota marmota]
MARGRISRLSVRDVRFPTSLGGHGSDAMVSLSWLFLGFLHLHLVGMGHLSFSIQTLTTRLPMLSWRLMQEMDSRDMELPSLWEKALKLIGPEKGVVHLATAAILNAVWDLWAKQEGKPLWKLLVDMDPRTLLSCIDFRYITDVLTEEDAYEEQMLMHGYPAYTTSCAWLGYSDDTLKQLCAAALKDGWTRFKVKVGADLQDDMRRCRLIRDMIGPEKTLAACACPQKRKCQMMDANQRWDVPEAVEWMSKLAEFKPLWIEEPTSPDDILGHATISKALVPLGIGVATGEQCHNRVIFKQLLQANALQFLQIDSCRLGSVNENLSVLLMAKKFGIPVCPHAGGVGLCELVQHLIIFDYISVSTSLKNRMCEYVDHLHEHFKYPVVIKQASYMPPKDAGYSTEMKEDSVRKHQYPDGDVWKKLLAAQEN